MKAIEWLGGHWAEGITAIATAASALFLWLQLRDQRRAQEPEVECTVRQNIETGWINIDLVVRNFHPHAMHVDALRIARPRKVKIFAGTGYKWNTVTQRSEAVMPGDLTNKISINSSVPPPYGAANAEGSVLKGTFQLVGVAPGRVRIKMFLMCELRTRLVRKQKIPITRTITLSKTSNAG